MAPLLLPLLILCATIASGGRLRVQLQNGVVPDMDSFLRGDTDAYVQLRLNPQDGGSWRFTSAIKADTLTPSWQQWFDFGDYVSPTNTISFQVFDDDKPLTADEYIGGSTFSVGASRQTQVGISGGYINFNIEYTPVNLCLINNGDCDPQYSCSNLGDMSRSCVCIQGQPCAPYINTCQTNNGGCGFNSNCTSTGSGTNTCQCMTRYEAPAYGRNCTAINNCRTNNGGCGANSVCTYTGPATNICTCLANHLSPTNDGKNCQPINNCNANNGGCGINSDCIFTGPALNTCQCKAGYEGGVAGANCTPINVCTNTPSICDALPYTSCVSTGPGTYDCACPPGFMGENCTVSFKNCDINNGNCGFNSTCSDTGPGLNTCACLLNHESLVGNGRNCTPIDPCRSAPDVCGANRFCSYAGPNAYTCPCIAILDNTCVSACPRGSFTAANRTCLACDPGTFSAAPGASQCAPWAATCAPGTQYEVSPPSSTADRRCANITVPAYCSAGLHQGRPYIGSEGSMLSLCTASQLNGTITIIASTLIFDATLPTSSVSPSIFLRSSDGALVLRAASIGLWAKEVVWDCSDVGSPERRGVRGRQDGGIVISNGGGKVVVGPGRVPVRKVNC